MKYCIHCLSENSDSAAHCKNCGFKFGQALELFEQKPVKANQKANYKENKNG